MKRMFIRKLKAHFIVLRYMKKNFIISAIAFLPALIAIVILLESFLMFIAGLSDGLRETLAFDIMGFALAFYCWIITFGLFFIAFAHNFGSSFKTIDKIEKRLMGED